MMHSMAIEDIHETLCGIKYKPLLFISSISPDKFRTVEDPCKDCLEILDKLEEKANHVR